VDKENQSVTLLEMSCPWVENREKKEKEKTLKYASLRLELKQQYPGYRINHTIDVLLGAERSRMPEKDAEVGAE